MKFACDEDGMYLFSPGVKRKKETQNVEKEIGHHDEEINIKSVPGMIEQVHIEELGSRVRQVRGHKHKGRKKVYVKGYNRQEVDRAIRARRLYDSLTAPDLRELKSFLRQNIMRNCPVPTDDVVLVERIFRKDIPTLKGKSTRSKSIPIKDE